jgi:primosomal protein N' (replication factor Y)
MGRLGNALCLLGSATPDVETMYRAKQGELIALSLPQRILAHRQGLSEQAARLHLTPAYEPGGSDVLYHSLPPVEVVDMRQELRAGHTSLFSRRLHERLSETLDRGEQAILFLNRRGSATHVFCRDCGWVLHCPRCEAPLSFHADEGRALCHRCGYRRGLPAACPECRGRRVRQFGAGTQEVVAETERWFPDARTIRWDRDATRARDAHEVILSHFAAHRADVLIGTQMITKGLDLPLVTLVGVVSADTGLHLPDFRAAERTFQLLTQVAGRAGRGVRGGRVVLQSYQPEHPAIQAASRHDYDGFYAAEIEARRALRYPPFTRLVRLVVHHADGAAAEKEARRVARLLQARLRELGRSTDLIGPAPCFFERVRGEARWQIVVRTDDPGDVLPAPLPQGWTVDVDPVTLL